MIAAYPLLYRARAGLVTALWSCLMLSVLALSVLPLRAAAGDPAHPAPAGDYFTPDADLAASLERARLGGKAGVAVLFEMEGCPECAKLRAETLAAPPLRDYLLQHFVTVSFHADTDSPLRDFTGTPTTATAFAGREPVVALPTLVLYDPEGTPVARRVGRAGELAQWLRLGRYVVERGYEEAPFAAWKPVNDVVN